MAGAQSRQPGWLDRQMAARPVATNSVASGLISVVAELLRHWLTSGRSVPPDLLSIVRQFTLGTVVVSPLATGWHGLVERLFASLEPGRLTTVLVKTAAEQTIFAPVINVSFMTTLGLMEGRSVEEIGQELRSKFVEVMRSNVAFWAPAGLIQYKFVPPRFRVLFAKVLSVAWMVFLISKTSKAAEVREAKAMDAVPVPAPKVPAKLEPTADVSAGKEELKQVAEGSQPGVQHPDHNGHWSLGRVDGDWEGFLTEKGTAWVKRKAYRLANYGVNRMTMKFERQGDIVSMTNVTRMETHMNVRIGGGPQDATSIEGDPIKVEPRWTDNGQVLEFLSRSPAGEELSRRRQWLEGDELVVELISVKGGISAKRYYVRT